MINVRRYQPTKTKIEVAPLEDMRFIMGVFGFYIQLPSFKRYHSAVVI